MRRNTLSEGEQSGPDQQKLRLHRTALLAPDGICQASKLPASRAEDSTSRRGSCHPAAERLRQQPGVVTRPCFPPAPLPRVAVPCTFLRSCRAVVRSDRRRGWPLAFCRQAGILHAVDHILRQLRDRTKLYHRNSWQLRLLLFMLQTS